MCIRDSGYELPSLALLTAPKPGDRQQLSDEAIQENARALESVLSDFGVRGEIIVSTDGSWRSGTTRWRRRQCRIRIRNSISMAGSSARRTFRL